MTSQVENYSHLSRVWKIFSALSVASSSEKPWRQMKTLIFSQPNNCFHVGDGLTWTAYMRQNISTISSRSISPEESLSYIRNAHLAQYYLFTPSFQHLYERNQGTNHVEHCACLSFSAGSPLLLMSVAIINSWNNSWEHLLLWEFSF